MPSSFLQIWVSRRTGAVCKTGLCFFLCLYAVGASATEEPLPAPVDPPPLPFAAPTKEELEQQRELTFPVRQFFDSGF